MNNADQPAYYPYPTGSLPKIPSFYMSNNASRIQVPNQVAYQLPMNNQPYINQQISEDYPQQFYVPSTFIMPANNVRPMNPPAFSLIRPSNENINYSQYISQNEYPLTYVAQNTSLPLTSTVYPQPLFPNNSIPSISSTISNKPKITQQLSETQLDLTEQMQNLRTKDTEIDEATVATSPSTIAQNIQQSNLCVSVVSSRKQRRRKKKLSCPIDSILNKPEEVSTQSKTSITTISSVSPTIVTSDNQTIEPKSMDTIKSNAKSKNRTRRRAKSIQQSAIIIAECSDIQTDKSDNQISTVNEEISTNLLQSQQTTIQNEKSLMLPKRSFHYDLQELLHIRDSKAPFPVPQRLVGLDIVFNQSDDNTSNQKRVNSSSLQKSLRTNCRILKHDQNNPDLTNDLSHKIEIQASTKPDFNNQVPNSSMLVDQNKIDADNRFLFDIRSMINKLTPQTYDQLQKQFLALDFDSYEKLEGMIMILHSKAIDEPHYSFLYAKLCKQLRKKYVNVTDKHGRLKKHTLRPLLMIYCKKEFNNDDIQESEYEKRKLELETITDEKKHQEEAEILENLIKARRRKLDNVV
ncbi:unnamed protein product [Rotaria sp. Silwood1]|nr:unnamed protein product [Rotaria sp. Silwood1]